MSRKFVLISCCKSKLNDGKCHAAESLYQGALFKKQLAYAKKLNADKIYILSALHGVVETDTQLAYYNYTIVGKPVAEVRKWANEKIIPQLKAKGADLQNDEFVILAGKIYYKELTPYLEKYIIPCQGLAIGRAMHKLNELLIEK